MKKITVYSTATCPYCKMLVEWLKKQNLEYTELKVDQDPVAAQNMISLSGRRSVPFTTIEDGEVTEKIYGFDVPKLTKILQGA